MSKPATRLSFVTIASAALIALAPSITSASTIDIYQFGLFLSDSQFSSSLEDTQIGAGANEFGLYGLDVQFTNNLTPGNTGSVTWRVTNNTGSDLSDVSVFGFLDAEIDQLVNGFDQETAHFHGSSADSYEIDEPGYVYGDIYDNLMAGALDGTNALSGLVDDVSFALGFHLGSFLDRAWFEATFEISLNNIQGIEHIDPDSGTSFFFNGSLSTYNKPVVTVPEPGSISLLLLGLFGLGIFPRFRKENIQ